MKGKPDLRVPSSEGRYNYDNIRKDCGCNLGAKCEHIYRRCIYSKFHPIKMIWECDCESKDRECIFI